MKTNLLLISIYLSGGIFTYAQGTPEKPGIGKGSIESQYNYMIYESEKQEDFRLVKAWWLYSIKKQVQDSLNEKKTGIARLEDTLIIKNNTIDSLYNYINELKVSLNSVTNQKNSVPFFGLSINKNVYNSVMWSITGVLAFLMLMFIILFKQNNKVTLKTQKLLNETKDEFDEFRKRALVREQQTVRKLYDEILKYKNKVQA